jgi:hypothetical protein
MCTDGLGEPSRGGAMCDQVALATAVRKSHLMQAKRTLYYMLVLANIGVVLFSSLLPSAYMC